MIFMNWSYALGQMRGWLVFISNDLDGWMGDGVGFGLPFSFREGRID